MTGGYSDKTQRASATELLWQLAFGVDPQTGLRLEADHLLNRPEVIRALVFAAETLQEIGDQDDALPDRPARAGVAWSKDEDAELRQLFVSRLPVSEIATALERKAGGIASRLVRLGIVKSRDQARAMLAAEPSG